MDETEVFSSFQVVINQEEQYSIWPVEKQVPAGWSTVGKSGSKSDCLSYIEEVWTDMRPLSLRRKMEAEAVPQETVVEAVANRRSLLDRLCEVEQEVRLPQRPSLVDLRTAIERGYIHLVFINTEGETELGLSLDKDKTEIPDAESGSGTISFIGETTLDYEKIRCVASIDIATRAGSCSVSRVSSTAD